MSAVEASGKILLDADALSRTLSRIAHEIIEANPDLGQVALVGIQTRGVPIAQRLARLIEERAGEAPELGAVDITFYRDDVHVRGGEAPLHAQPVVRETQLDFPLEGRTVVLVDDVLYTGRTIRAAIEALFDYGRPARVQLAVIVDRGHRELPIRPDYIGKNLPTARSERIQVQLSRWTRSTRSCSCRTRRRGPNDVPSIWSATTCGRRGRRRAAICSRSPTSRATTSSACSAPRARSRRRSTAR